MMSVDELIQELEQLQSEGHGDALVMIPARIYRDHVACVETLYDDDSERLVVEIS